MTERYLGMNAHTGLAISEVEHIRQSVRDILVTPVGSRVMRRESVSYTHLTLPTIYSV